MKWMPITILGKSFKVPPNTGWFLAGLYYATIIVLLFPVIRSCNKESHKKTKQSITYLTYNEINEDGLKITSLTGLTTLQSEIKRNEFKRKYKNKYIKATGCAVNVKENICYVDMQLGEIFSTADIYLLGLDHSVLANINRFSDISFAGRIVCIESLPLLGSAIKISLRDVVIIK